ncbi:MAG: hypothetical protein H7Y31_12080 [Chitinophagaceae bacterium]|nr:hypothetical protein [Chitinophagaceae bacterium]
MNNLKKILGLVWMVVAPLVIITLVLGAITYIDSNGKKDINNPIIWIIIISIFTPIAIGLMIFGWYAFKDDYQKLPDSSIEITN